MTAITQWWKLILINGDYFEANILSTLLYISQIKLKKYLNIARTSFFSILNSKTNAYFLLFRFTSLKVMIFYF